MQKFRVFVRSLLVMAGAVLSLVGVFATFGLVFMFAAGLFGHPITWLQGSVLALVIKLVGMLMVPKFEVKMPKVKR